MKYNDSKNTSVEEQIHQIQIKGQRALRTMTLPIAMIIAFAFMRIFDGLFRVAVFRVAEYVSIVLLLINILYAAGCFVKIKKLKNENQ